jgi:hypothetical protein
VVTYLEGDNLLVFYYHRAFEIWATNRMTFGGRCSSSLLFQYMLKVTFRCMPGMTIFFILIFIFFTIFINFHFLQFLLIFIFYNFSFTAVQEGITVLVYNTNQYHYLDYRSIKTIGLQKFLK